LGTDLRVGPPSIDATPRSLLSSADTFKRANHAFSIAASLALYYWSLSNPKYRDHVLSTIVAARRSSDVAAVAVLALLR